MPKRAPKERLNENDHKFAVLRELLRDWEPKASFNPDPEILPELLRDSRVADNVRPLLSIADTFGAEYGASARAAMVRFCTGSFDRSPHIRALKAANTVCEECEKEGMEYIEYKTLAKAIAVEDDYSVDWRGASDKGRPHEITSGEVSRLLKLSGIRSQTYWPRPRTSTSRSFRACAIKSIKAA
jgi:hypothetical protein